MNVPRHVVLQGLQSPACPAWAGLLVGVSGGADSTALLHILAETRAEHGLALKAVHVQHQLRGVASEADAALVAELCTQWGIDYVPMDRPIPTGSGIEVAARDARLHVWQELLNTHPGWAVALGHHADDQAETVLWRLARGSSPRGVAGMRCWSNVGEVPFFRPFLTLRHQQLIAYLEQAGIPWREDASNQSDQFTRNRIRHQLLPTMAEAWGSDPVPGLGEAAAMLQEDDAWLSQQASEALDALRTPEGIAYAALSDLPDALARRVLLAWLQEQGQQVSARSVMQWLADPQPLQLPGGEHRLRCREGMVQLASMSISIPADFEAPLPAPGGCLALPDQEWILRVSELPSRQPGRAAGPGAYPASACLPLDLVGQLQVRSWRVGDRYRPLGLGGGSRKLQDVWVDSKVPRSHRGRVPLVCVGETILWVAGGEVSVEGAVEEGAPCLYVQVESSS